ncbi:hypothetical protein A33O_07815 [Nitratireductor aquibiodomus RA22]|uniref:YhdP central domain-containing protein n=1 Tax=Nitratireductor aquibiodomus RA22 TaxID=1189611 RepID=I5C1D5_9HYPH|nr:DUF3971 domain-containing protein [Nitratireductor aquibiodomus]EIM75637.1 hypothetical protein A33O_07815 [Nitratireductor aquibiodomus RA22]
MWLWLRRCIGGLFVIIALLVSLGVAIQLLGTGSFGQDRLRSAAQKALTALAGFEVEATMGSLRIVLSDRSLIALEIRDVNLTKAETGETLIDAETLHFGFRLLPLLRGQVQVGSAEITGARVQLASLSSRPEEVAAVARWKKPVDPRVIEKDVFDGLRRVYALTERTGTRYLRLRDVVVVVDETTQRSLAIDVNASMAPSGKLDFKSSVTFDDRDIELSGSALRPVREGPIKSLDIEIAAPKPSLLEAARTVSGQTRRTGGLLEAVRISLSGGETGSGNGRLQFELALEEAPFDLGEDGVLTATGRIRAAVEQDAGAIAINRASLIVGRSVFDFTGRIVPVENPDAGSAVYRFELVSGKSTIAPIDSPEAAVPFVAGASGRIDTGSGRIIGDTIRIATTSGVITASAAVTLAAGKTPGLSLAVYTKGMPTHEVKQFWPWFAASGAREWVLENLFGGRVVEGNLRLRVPPGRFGNGKPLDNEEVSGAFEVADARFDIAGRIPPVRDAVGRIAFQGADIDIGIEAGMVFMPSGRKVAASNGSLRVRNAHVKPRIGKLEIDVAGKAPAIIELASYEPIDVSDRIDLAPQDVTGDVTGHVKADIPLSDGIPREDLGWQATLEYENLSISKPFDGQMVADASGVLMVEPGRADISASATLNGIPARLELVEPFGESGVERSRRIQLTLDDKLRNKVVPGLDEILSGPMTVDYSELDDGRKALSVKLDKARLTLPWINWSKGAGIPATASFVLDEKPSSMALTDFRLSGETFSAAGHLSIAGGSLSSARFERARLNRGDDFSVSIDRSERNYRVTVRGAALDGRSLIKHYLGAEQRGAGGGASEADSANVNLDAKLARVSGFGGAVLRDVSLKYASSQRGPGRLDLTAKTTSGGAVTLARDASGIVANSSDAGAVMRFVDFYENMEGGQMALSLSEGNGGVLSGRVSAQNFFIVDEPRLRSLVSATENNGEVDANRISFERGYATVLKGPGRLELKDGVLRGPLIGTTFQGTLFDADDNIAITGTFMPLYGLNRIFGEIPVFGGLLGNGRDRGLIGITYRLYGKLAEPQMEVNPISAIAPGIFRQIFEFR